MARALTLRPPAKINLTLRVGQRQADGFHDVQTIMQTIGLCDALTLTPSRGPLKLVTRTRTTPADRTNLVWRAASAMWDAVGRTGDPRDVHVTLNKAIPLAAGLGGGSADAAATLVGLNLIWGLQLSRRDLARIASPLGSDIPFFLTGGTAIGVGRGDDVFPLQELPRLGVVIIKPSFGVRTADAYRWLDADRAEAVAAAGQRTRTLEVGWPTGPLALTNDLEEPVVRRHPAVAEAIAACLGEGARAAAMTGSGSAVFGVFSEAMAPKAARRLRRPDWVVLPTRTLSRAESNRLIGL